MKLRIRIRASLLPFLLGALGVGGGLLWWSASESRELIRASLSLQESLGAEGSDPFRKAVVPEPIRLEKDLGPHRDFRLEWWYFTGNLQGEGGRRFGFQATFFRTGLMPGLPERRSRWATHHLYSAHFAITDVAEKRFFSAERFQREALDLAGARAEPFAVWVDGWEAASVGGMPFPIRLRLEEDGAALELTLDNLKPVVLHGDRGLSQKGPTPGNASYYFSLTRLRAQGALSLGDRRWDVSGEAWMDREWGSSFLEPFQEGWDWFSIQLGNRQELMLARIRSRDPSQPEVRFGTWVREDGSAVPIAAEGIVLRPVRWWQSRLDETRYPIRWEVRLTRPLGVLSVIAEVEDQEHNLSTRYWEGAVRIEGELEGHPVRGWGYMELTGYAATDRRQVAQSRER